MQTPPKKVGLTNSDDVPTVIVDRTPQVDYSKFKPMSGTLGKRNLQTELDDAHGEYLKNRIENINKELQQTEEDHDNSIEEYQNRVNETAKMTLKLPLPKKPKQEGGRKSNKKNKKHRKKTSKKRRSRK
jgi:hypothetical protein